ncbi:hypothetical protein M0R04_13235 [Candidatus Dojkabacteria bacterium]|jgi:hypothetical protein|nr:hypothetical protein [Candidatus Dojkabacteria bacterium]
MEQFEIARSFSKTVQIRPFEPEQYFCSVKQSFSEMPTEKVKEETSEYLIWFAKKEVMKMASKSIEERTPESEKFIEEKDSYKTQRSIEQNNYEKNTEHENF